MSDNKKLIKNYVYNTLYQILVLLTPLITTPYVSRVLGVAGIGIYSYAQSIATYFVLVGAVGTTLYGQREIAYVQNDPIKRTEVFWEITIFRFISVTICTVIFALIFGLHGQYSEIYRILILEVLDCAISMAGFILKNTLSDNGGVTRGICRMESGHSHVTDVIETGNIIKTVDPVTGDVGAEADGNKLNPESYVSMNFWGFPATDGSTPAFLDVLESHFRDFFIKEVPVNPSKAEYLLPTLIGGMLRRKECTVKVLETHDKWFGVTYKEDNISHNACPLLT